MILNTNRLKIVSLSYEELFDYVINKKGFVKTDEDERKVWDYTIIPMRDADEKDHLFYTFWCGFYEGEDILQAGFLRPVNEHGTVEIWIHVKDEYMGKGFGTEAIKALTEFAKGYEKIDYVGASVELDNHASKRMLIKSGFEYGGVHKEVDIFYFNTKI